MGPGLQLLCERNLCFERASLPGMDGGDLRSSTCSRYCWGAFASPRDGFCCWEQPPRGSSVRLQKKAPHHPPSHRPTNPPPTSPTLHPTSYPPTRQPTSQGTFSPGGSVIGKKEEGREWGGLSPPPVPGGDVLNGSPARPNIPECPPGRSPGLPSRHSTMRTGGGRLLALGFFLLSWSVGKTSTTAHAMHRQT